MQGKKNQLGTNKSLFRSATFTKQYAINCQALVRTNIFIGQRSFSNSNDPLTFHTSFPAVIFIRLVNVAVYRSLLLSSPNNKKIFV